MDNKHPVSSPPSPQPEKTPKKPNARLVLAALTFIVLVASVGIAGKFAPTKTPLARQITTIKPTTTPDPIANWQMYNNPTFYYSINYPQGWTINEKKIGNNLETQLSPIIASCPTNINPFTCETSQVITIAVLENPKGLTVEAYIDANNTHNIAYQSIYIDSVEAKRSKNIPAQFIQDSVFIKKDKKIYKITHVKVIGKGTKEIADKEFDQILSTFKFTSATPSAGSK